MSGDMFFIQYMKVSVLQLTFNPPSIRLSELQPLHCVMMSNGSWTFGQTSPKKIDSHHRLQPEDDGCISSCEFHSAAFIFY